MKSTTETDIIINYHTLLSNSLSQTHQLELIPDMDLLPSAQQNISTDDHIQFQERNNNEALGNIIQHIDNSYQISYS